MWCIWLGEHFGWLVQGRQLCARCLCLSWEAQLELELRLTPVLMWCVCLNALSLVILPSVCNACFSTDVNPWKNSLDPGPNTPAKKHTHICTLNKRISKSKWLVWDKYRCTLNISLPFTSWREQGDTVHPGPVLGAPVVLTFRVFLFSLPPSMFHIYFSAVVSEDSVWGIIVNDASSL